MLDEQRKVEDWKAIVAAAQPAQQTPAGGGEQMWQDVPKKSTFPWQKVTLGVVIVSGLVFAGVMLAGSRNKQSVISVVNPFSASADVIASVSASPSASVSHSATPSASVGVSAIASASTSPTPTTSATVSTCTLPTFADVYHGYQIGKPDLWLISQSNGMIVEASDTNDSTIAFVYPVRLESGITNQDMTDTYNQLLIDTFSRSGGSITITNGQISGTWKGDTIKGIVSTKTTSSSLIIYGGWSPTDRWTKDQPIIQKVADCYSPMIGRALKVTSISSGDVTNTINYEARIPDGWQYTSLAVDKGFDVVGDTNSVRMFTRTVLGAMGSTTLDTVASQVLDGVKVSQPTFLGEKNETGSTDILGNSWDIKTKEFSGIYNGQNIHGTVTVGLDVVDDGQGFGTYSYLATVRFAEASTWSQVASITAVIQSTIKITNDKPGKNIILPTSEPAAHQTIFGAEIYSQLSADRLLPKRKAVLSVYSHVRSGIDKGDYYVPLNSYQINSSLGTGYYRYATVPAGKVQEKFDTVQ